MGICPFSPTPSTSRLGEQLALATAMNRDEFVVIPKLIHSMLKVAHGLMVLELFCAVGCGRPDAPTVPKQRLPYDRDVVQIELPTTDRTPSLRRLGDIPASSEIEFSCYSDSKDSAEITSYSVFIKTHDGRTVRAANLQVARRERDKIYFIANPVYLGRTGEFTVELVSNLRGAKKAAPRLFSINVTKEVK